MRYASLLKDGRKWPRALTSCAVAGAVFIFSTQAAQAWITAGAGNVYNETGTYNVFNECSINAGQGIYAQDGDVVTTQKWNQVVCRFAQLWSFMKDEGRQLTGAFDFRTSVIGGAKGYFLQNIGLGYDAWSDAGAKPGMWFFDATKPYGTAWVERKAHVSYEASTQKLQLAGFDGGVEISEHADDNGDDAVDRTGFWKIGWVKVSLYDTAPFDPDCQYRVRTDHGHTIHMPVTNAGDLRGYLDDSAYPELGNPVRVQIWATNKTGWHNPSTYGSAANSTGYGTYVTKIEKLCLPSYEN